MDESSEEGPMNERYMALQLFQSYILEVAGTQQADIKTQHLHRCVLLIPDIK